MKLDLHIHSNCSDGSDDWKTILKNAQELGIECVSITDHNNVDAYFQMQNPQNYFSGKIINGIEPECCYKGRIIELLGYGINVEIMRDSLKGLYSPTEVVDKSHLEKSYAKLVKGGVKFSDNVLTSWDKNKFYYPTCHLHADIIKYPENRLIINDEKSWKNSVQFFRSYISNASSPFYVDDSEHCPSAQTIARLIKKAGGKVFIPHIFLYGDDSEMLLNGLTSELEIDGIECFYSSFKKEQTDYLLNFCKQKNLLISAGSDYHGTYRPHIKIGVSDERLDDNMLSWLKQV